MGKYDRFIAAYVSTIENSHKFDIYPSFSWLGVRIPAIIDDTSGASVLVIIILENNFIVTICHAIVTVSQF